LIDVPAFLYASRDDIAERGSRSGLGAC